MSERSRLGAGERAVRAALRRRGFRWNGERDPTPLLVPEGTALSRHYRLLGHYSYRLFLRDVLRSRGGLRAERLARYVSEPVAGRYLRFLVAAGLVVRDGPGRHRLADERIVSFGGTLEWYVAALLEREFGCAVAWGLRIPHARGGGDYDVMACAEGELWYVETKSAPPRQIVDAEIAAFLGRVDTLRPDLAIFLDDTTLRMRDKLVPMFAAAIARRGLGWSPLRVEREIWSVGPEIYLVNADPQLARNLGTCLARHLRGRGIALAP